MNGPAGSRLLAAETDRDRSAPRVPNRIVTYYQGHALMITHEVVEVWWPTHRRYAVGALHGPYVSRGPSAPAPVRTVSIVALAFGAVAAMLPIVTPIPVWAVGVFAVVALAGIGGIGLRPAPVSWELRAIHAGSDICLYQSTDTLVFGQVKRALVRALEARAQ
jgi:uncharacterized protein DUF6232